jgi:hypothetical protein
MQIHNKIQILVFWVLVILAVIAGPSVGVKLYQNEVIVNGILGVTIWVMLLIHIQRPIAEKEEKKPNLQVELPRDLKFVPMGFFVSMVVYWAGAYIIDLVRYLYHSITIW